MGALGTVRLHQFEYISAVDIDGEVIKLYRDKEKMRDYFLQIAPEDKKHIGELYQIITAFENFEMPVEMPIDMRKPLQLFKYLF